jgi:hypothetical protein
MSLAHYLLALGSVYMNLSSLLVSEEQIHKLGYFFLFNLTERAWYGELSWVEWSGVEWSGMKILRCCTVCYQGRKVRLRR